MRRSFGGNGNMGGGGGMLRTVQRVVRAGVGGGAQEPFSQSTANSNSSAVSSNKRHPCRPTTSPVISLSSSSSLLNFPAQTISALSIWPYCSSPSGSEEFDWECVEGSEYEKASGCHDDFVFGPAPSGDEVQEALSALQQFLDRASFSHFTSDYLTYHSGKDVAGDTTTPRGVMNRVSSVGKDLDWIEPSLQLCSPRMLWPCGSNRAYDTLHILWTDPCIRRMVSSLSSDDAVWNAVMNNEAVRQVRESLLEADNSIPHSPEDSSDGSDTTTNILSWIFNNTKAKVVELIDKITKLVNELFQPLNDEKKTGGDSQLFEEKLRASFMLSIIVLLIVVVSRAHRA
ncbi:hypothetical protein NMG60_11018253 [Bertholletia excelsa]